MPLYPLQKGDQKSLYILAFRRYNPRSGIATWFRDRQVTLARLSMSRCFHAVYSRPAGIAASTSTSFPFCLDY